VEVKKDIHDFNYNQFVAQLLVQATNELADNPIQKDEIVEACGISLCGYRLRFATLSCPVSYLKALQQGDVGAIPITPTLCLSKQYTLLEREARAWALGVIYGKLKQLHAKDIILIV